MPSSKTMLRVSYSDTQGGQRWVLYGSLTGLWVDELRSLWRQIRERTANASAVVDLTDVTFIDDAGERLLAEMKHAGTEFIAAGVDNTHLIATLNEEQRRPVRRRVEDLNAGCEEFGTVRGEKSEKDNHETARNNRRGYSARRRCFDTHKPPENDGRGNASGAARRHGRKR